MIYVVNEAWLVKCLLGILKVLGSIDPQYCINWVCWCKPISPPSTQKMKPGASELQIHLWLYWKFKLSLHYMIPRLKKMCFLNIYKFNLLKLYCKELVNKKSHSKINQTINLCTLYNQYISLCSLLLRCFFLFFF